MQQNKTTMKSFQLLLPAIVLTGCSTWLLFAPGGLLPFADDLLRQERHRLDSLRQTISDLREQNRQLRLVTQPMVALRAGTIDAESEDAARQLREQVERIAQAAGATIHSLREIQQIAVTEEWSGCSLNFSVICSITVLQKFLSEVDNSMPRLYWRNLTLRPDNTTAPENILLDGQLILLNRQGALE